MVLLYKNRFVLFIKAAGLSREYMVYENLQMCMQLTLVIYSTVKRNKIKLAEMTTTKNLTPMLLYLQKDEEATQQEKNCNVHKMRDKNVAHSL